MNIGDPYGKDGAPCLCCDQAAASRAMRGHAGAADDGAAIASCLSTLVACEQLGVDVVIRSLCADCADLLETVRASQKDVAIAAQKPGKLLRFRKRKPPPSQ